MDFRFWNLSTASNMFNSSQQGPFPSNVTSYFRKPSKVVKPSSKNNSPRTSSRRRMTTTGHIPVRTRSVVDRQRASMPQLSDGRSTTSRPISWHPHMMHDMSQFQLADYSTNENFLATPHTTAEINGLVTPLSYPLVDEPQIHDLISPLQGLSATEAESGYGYCQDFDMSQYWLSGQAKNSTIDLDPSLYPIVNYPLPLPLSPLPMVLPPQAQWYPANQYINIMPNVPTAPNSPSFDAVSEHIPPVGFGAPGAALEPPTEELVGMGLYDSPAEVQSSSLLLGGTCGASTRRTLKLEDSFEPSPHDDDEESEEDDEDGVASEEDDINEPGVSPTTMNYPQQPTAFAIPTSQILQTAPATDSSYIVNQWHMPTQPSYGWI